MKQAMNSLEKHRDALTYCLQCGLCLSECPVFKSSRLSSLTSRGRMKILAGIIDGELTVSKRVAEILDNCLMCEACVNICPSGVPVGKIMASARALVNEEQGIPLVKRMALWTLGNQRRAGKLAKFAAPFSKLAFKAEKDGGVPRSLVTGLSPLSKIPNFGSETFLEKYSGIHEPASIKIGSIAYFVGCMTNLCYQETGKAVLNYLLKQGYQVSIPKGQECCGLPAFASGDIKEATKLAQINWETFAQLNVDAIIADCSSCVSMWRHHLPELVDAKEKTLPVQEVMGFLAAHDKSPQELEKGRGLKIGYHAPCHTKGNDIARQAPKNLLKNSKAVQYITLDTEEKCCGGGGSFGALHPELMKDIQCSKLEEIEDKEIEVLTTTCPSCRMYLIAGLKGAGLKTRVCHPLELT